MCVPVRLVRRLVMSSRPCVSFRASRLRRIVRLIRLACSSRSSFRLSARFARRLGLAPFRSAVRSFLLRLPERDCLAFPCRLVSHWHPVCLSSCSSSCRSVPPTVSSCSSCFCPVISFSLIRGRFGSVFMSVPVFAPFRSAVRSFSFCLSGRFCLAFSCRLVLVSLLRLVRRLVGSSCSLPSSRFCLTRGRLGSVLVLGSRVRAVLSCCSLVPVRPVRHRFMSSVVGRGCASWSWGGRGLLFSSHPSHHGSLLVAVRSWRFARCVMALWEDGDMGGAVPCCSPLIPCPLMPSSFLFIPSVSIVLSLRSLIPSSTKQDNGVGRRTDGGWQKANEENETHGRDG